jgi:hypothetical protein
MTAEVTVSRIAPWLWAALSVAALLASFVAAFAILAAAGTIGLRPSEVGGLRTDLATLLGLFAFLASAGVMAAARVAFGHWPSFRASDATVPAAGIGLAIAVELGLHAWVQARYTYYDWQMVGWTAGLSTALITLAVATLASRVAPRGSALPPLLAQVTAATLVMVIVLSNVGGVADGIEPGSWLLAILVGLSVAYAAVAVGIGIRRMSAG